MIATVEIRVVAGSEADALAAIAALREAVGAARLALNTPRPGRDKAGDGNPQWLCYGTFQFETESGLVTGPTRRLRR